MQLHRFFLCTLISSAMLIAAPASPAQESAVTMSPVSVVPHVIKFSGALPGASNNAETVEVKFALYAAQTGGEALWSETQQVSLDTTGKYSVLLGSVSALPNAVFANGQARWIGVTLGSEQESARTILVATPYSLKASDAETLGGHPVSDFTLKNVHPAGGTDITQITVGSGITGGGTGPTVTLGLSSSYLETLGNGIYPQIGGTNTMTGTNKFTAGKLLLGTSPVLSASAILGSSPVTATISGNTVKIGLSDSALLTLGNGVYSQLTANNSFSGANTFTKAITFASGQTFAGTATIAGNNTFAGTNTFSKTITFASGQTFPGVASLASNDSFTGLVTISGTEASGENIGSIGSQLTVNDTSTSASAIPVAVEGNTSIGIGSYGQGAIGVLGYSPAPVSGYISEGVYGIGTDAGGVFSGADGGTGSGAVNGIGVVAGGYVAIQANGDFNAGVGVTATGYYGVIGTTGPLSNIGQEYQPAANGLGVQGDTTAGHSFAILGTSDDGYAAVLANNSPDGDPTLDVENNDTTGVGEPFLALNTVNYSECAMDENANFGCSGSLAAIHSVDGRKVKTYGVQSAENWIEDFGSGHLASGTSHISLDPTFAGTVNTGSDYHVFLTPRGDSEGLYVANVGPDGFDVRESRKGRSNIDFDYRIVAKRKGYENVRMEDVTAKLAADVARHEAMVKHAADAPKRPRPTQLRDPRSNPLFNPTRSNPTMRSAAEPQKQK